MSGFAVVAVGTTGLAPTRHHRVMEIAIVRIAPDGRVEDEWSTLVDPGCDLGSQQTRGVEARDVRGAPTFGQVAPFIVELLRGRVVVAHNAPFVARFLRHELRLTGIHAPLPDAATVCTMDLARRFLPDAPRGLAICCEIAGVAHDGARWALGDARATAGLLQYYLEVGGSEPHWSVAADAVRALEWQGWEFVFAVRSVTRAAGRPRATWLSGIADRLVRADDPASESGPPDSYLALLDAALLDQDTEIGGSDELARIAKDSGIRPEELAEVHRRYVASLNAAALARTTRAAGTGELCAIARALGVDDLESASGETTSGETTSGEPATVETPTAPDLGGAVLRPGDDVAFSDGLLRPYAEWSRQARTAGLTPCRSVTPATRVVVAAETDTLSGANRTARRYGVPVVTEDAFVRLRADVVAR